MALYKTPKSLTSAEIIEAFWIIQKHQESSNAMNKGAYSANRLKKQTWDFY